MACAWISQHYKNLLKLSTHFFHNNLYNYNNNTLYQTLEHILFTIVELFANYLIYGLLLCHYFFYHIYSPCFCYMLYIATDSIPNIVTLLSFKFSFIVSGPHLVISGLTSASTQSSSTFPVCSWNHMTHGNRQTSNQPAELWLRLLAFPFKLLKTFQSPLIYKQLNKNFWIFLFVEESSDMTSIVCM